MPPQVLIAGAGPTGLMLALWLARSGVKVRLIEKAPGTKVYWLELSVAYEKVGDFDKSLATMRLAQQAGLLGEDGDFRRLSYLLVHQGLPFQGAEVLDQALTAPG